MLFEIQSCKCGSFDDVTFGSGSGDEYTDHGISRNARETTRDQEERQRILYPCRRKPDREAVLGKVLDSPQRGRHYPYLRVQLVLPNLYIVFHVVYIYSFNIV